MPEIRACLHGYRVSSSFRQAKRTQASIKDFYFDVHLTPEAGWVTPPVVNGPNSQILCLSQCMSVILTLLTNFDNKVFKKCFFLEFCNHTNLLNTCYVVVTSSHSKRLCKFKSIVEFHR